MHNKINLEKMDDGFVLVTKETLQKLVSNFYAVCSLADEMNIYEFPEGDERMQEMKSWTNKKFGREINKETYE
jgi:hypothetical protein